MFHYKKKRLNKKTKTIKAKTKQPPQQNLNPACSSDIYLLRYSHFLRHTWIW